MQAMAVCANVGRKWLDATGSCIKVGLPDAAEVIDRDAATDWGGAARALGKYALHLDWRNAMRAILALSLLITLCASANAATVRHPHRHAAVRASQGMILGPSPGWTYTAPAGARAQYAPGPVYNDQPDPRVDNPYKNWGG
jgi:hypothetical protein